MNKLKVLLISTCCVVTAFLADTQGMEDDLVPNGFVKDFNGNKINVAIGIPYKLENKWHRDQGKPSSLDAEGDNGQGRIYRSNYHNDYTSWYLTPQNYNLKAVIQNFQYVGNPLDILNQQKRPVSVLAKTSFRNPTNATLTEVIDKTWQTTDTATWSFEESSSLHFSDTFTIHAEASASFLGIVSAKAETTNVFTWDWKKDSKNSLSKTFTASDTVRIQKSIQVPPHTNLDANTMINRAQNIPIPFTAEVKITALSDRLKRNGKVAKMVPVDLDALRLFLERENYQGNIFRTEGNAVYAQIRGTITADVGFETIVSTENVI